ncbi:MAG TPA: tRNA lysidine(34) synthetase TilS [Spirochaetota bacterium]|nr:tRNA lysidine(34) synthetase TilS [Spirochaetota bacterium]
MKYLMFFLHFSGYVGIILNTIEKVTHFIDKHNMVKEGDKILLSMSAGKDSVFLFDVFMKIKNQLRIQFSVFHLNHKTRNGESDLDARFVENLCRENNIDCFMFEHSFGNIPSFEETARDKRYELLQKTGEENSFNKIATAHNADDNHETVLMRLFSGTSIYGMRGISPVRGNFIRPILSVGIDEIYDYLERNKLSFRYDSSNDDEKYLRNYMRKKIFSAVSKRFPDYRNALDSIISHSRETDDFISSLIYDYFDITKNIDSVEFIEKKEAPAYIFKKAVSDIFRSDFHTYISGEILDEIIRKNSSAKRNIVLYSSGKICLERIFTNDKIIFRFSRVHKTPEAAFNEFRCAIDDISGCRTEALDNIFYFELLEFSDNINLDDSEVIYVDVSSSKSVSFEQKKDGDRFLSGGKMKKIKELFIEKKMNNYQKSSFPLINIDSVTAVLPFAFYNLGKNRVSDVFMVKSGTKKILAIRSAGKIQ